MAEGFIIVFGYAIVPGLVMNLRDLEYVVAVAELRSFSRAASRCNVSQPTLSTQLKKLEDELGVVLFERSNKHVRLTETGSQIIPVARRVLSDSEEILEVARNAQDPLGGSVRICAIPTLASYVFPQLVAQLRSQLPNAKIILSEEKTDVLTMQLANGDIDFGLAALPIDEPGLVSKKLFEDPFFLAVSNDHELARKKRVSLTALSSGNYPLLLLEDGHCLGEQALSICSANRLNVANDLRATSLETLRQMVIAGTGITLIPRIAARENHPAIRYLPISGQTQGRTIGIVWRKSMPRLQLLEKLCSIVEGLIL